MELLAPAGNEQAFMNALNNGANAIYLGVGDFNARKKADNFTFDILERCIKYAHFFGVKVYLTLNTLIKNSEIENFLETAKKCYEMGIDAFIVQDLGMAKLVRKFFPEISIHASTQMGISDYESAVFAFEEMGVKRVVLSREVDEKEISKIAQIKGLETEIFVHGALCVSFSGNCYFSAIQNGNSGNRGGCLQPCRKCYKMDNGRKGYFLSTKDICLIDQISKLKEIGVTSLKIEGRLKRDEYVGGVVKTYRKAIDSSVSSVDKKILKRLFNRGDFSKGYLGNIDDLMFEKVQGHLGESVMKIVRVEKNLIFATSNEEITNGDCFKIISDGCETGSAVSPKKIDSKTYSLIFKGDAKVGDSLNITTDESLILEINSYPKLINKVNLEFIAHENQLATLKAECNGKSAEVFSQQVCDQAKNQPLSKTDVLTSFNKISGFPIQLENVDVELGNVFLPKSVLNSMRRDVFEKLIQQFTTVRQSIDFESYSFCNLKENECKTNIVHCDGNAIKDGLCQNNGELSQNKRKIKNRFAIFSDVSQINKKVLSKIDGLIYYPEVFDLNYSRIFNNQLTDLGFDKEVYLFIPCFLRSVDREVIENILIETPFNSAINSLNFVNFSKKNNKKILVLNFNVFNSESIKFLDEQDVQGICLSKELSGKEISDIVKNSNSRLFVNCYGNIDLMQLNHCPNKSFMKGQCGNCNFKSINYVDDYSESFAVKRNKIKNCYFRLINPVVLDLRKELKSLNISEIYNFEGLTSKQIEQVLDGETICKITKSIFFKGVN